MCVVLPLFVLFCFVFVFVLCCVVLCCVVLCCVVLFCFVLFCFVLFCFVLFCFVLFCFVLFCFVLFCFVLFYVPMPDVPAVHDIDTPRRTIGGRCRKWCISAQPPAGKRKCAACSMCGTRFTHGEARLQQWCNSQTNNHYVHAHCVNAGLGHDHELHPKVAD